MNAKADQGSDDTLLVQCDSVVVNDLMQHLKLYKLRSNVQLAMRSDIEVLIIHIIKILVYTFANCKNKV